MNKFKSLMKKYGAALGALALSVGVMVSPLVSHAADFDATDTQATLTTAIGNITPVLKYGIGAVLLVGLSIWGIFYIIRLLKRHVR